MILDAKLFPAIKMFRYPHMFPRDIEIWERFIEKHGQEYEGFIYDWKVGTGTEPVEELREPFITMQKHLSKYRVDVIGVASGRLDLIEVKPNAGTGAIGQIISYVKLFTNEHKSAKKVRPMLVTDFERPDVRKLASDFGIKYYVL